MIKKLQFKELFPIRVTRLKVKNALKLHKFCKNIEDKKWLMLT